MKTIISGAIKKITSASRMGLTNSAVDLSLLASVSTVKNQRRWFQTASPLRRRYMLAAIFKACVKSRMITEFLR